MLSRQHVSTTTSLSTHSSVRFQCLLLHNVWMRIDQSPSPCHVPLVCDLDCQFQCQFNRLVLLFVPQNPPLPFHRCQIWMLFGHIVVWCILTLEVALPLHIRPLGSWGGWVDPGSHYWRGWAIVLQTVEHIPYPCPIWVWLISRPHLIVWSSSHLDFFNSSLWMDQLLALQPSQLDQEALLPSSSASFILSSLETKHIILLLVSCIICESWLDSSGCLWLHSSHFQMDESTSLLGSHHSETLLQRIGRSINNHTINWSSDLMTDICM